MGGSPEGSTVMPRVLVLGASLPCRDALDVKVAADARSNGAAGSVLPVRAATMPLPDLTAACPVPMVLPTNGHVVQ
jgi:hypothetical protein